MRVNKIAGWCNSLSTLGSQPGDTGASPVPASNMEVTVIKILKFVLATSICFCLSIPVFATGETPTGSNYVWYNSSNGSNYADYWSATSNNLGQIVLRLPYGSTWHYYDGDSTYSSGTFWKAISDSLYYIGRDLYYIKSDVSNIGTKLDTLNSSITTGNSTLSTISSRVNTTNSRLSTTNSHLDSIKSFLSDLHDIFANQTDLTLKNNQDNNVREATTDFLSGSASSTSIGTGTIRSIKGSFGDAQDFFGMGEGIDIFGALSDDSSDGPWQWFTQAVKDDISTVQVSRDELYIDFLSPKNEDLLSRLGDEEDDDR